MKYMSADTKGLNTRLNAVALALAGLAGTAAFAAAGGTFLDSQAVLTAGALIVLLIVLAAGIRVRVTTAHLSLAALMLVFISAGLQSVWPVESFIKAGQLVGYGAIFLAASSLTGRNRVRLTAHLLVAIGVVVAVRGLYGYLVGFEAQIRDLIAAGHPDQARQLANMGGRAFANFAGANSFAGFLALIAPIAFGLFIYEKNIKLRIWLGLALAALSAALYFTFSKGALLAIAAAAVVFIIGRLRKSSRAKGLLIGSLAAVLVGVPLYIFWRFYRGDIGAAVANTEGRVELWRAAWHILERHPRLGIGPGAFATELTHYQIGSVFSPFAHNTYLQMAAETGVVGLIALVVVIVSLLVLAWRSFDAEAGGDDWLRLGLLAALIGFFAHNVVDYTWYVPGVAVAFWLAAGVAVAPTGDAPVVGAQFSIGRYIAVALTAILLLPTLFVFAGAGYASTGAWLRDEYELTRAEEFMRRSLALFPQNAEARDGLAQTLYLKALTAKKKSAPEAVENERLAIALRPSWPFYHARLADYLGLSGRDKEALREYRRAMSLYPLEPRIPLRAGNYLISRGRYVEALGMFRSATRLGGVYGEDIHTAADLATARQDVSGPLTAIAYSHMGEVRALLGLSRYREAATALAKAERLLGQAPDMNKQAGSLIKSGKRQAAIRELEELIRIAPNYSPTKRLLKRLKASE